jgi:nucleotide-binding universal stress UspA family protein
MHLNHILAACDESDAGRDAVRTALGLATRSGAAVSVVRVESPAPALAEAGKARVGFHSSEDHPDVGRLRRWLEADPIFRDAAPVQVHVTCGIPGIEICRAAERLDVGLIVLGRKQHSQRARLMLGDTADAVARRSRFPCLLVPPKPRPLRSMLVALDGTDRGMRVLDEACAFARQVGAELRVVTVERAVVDEPAHPDGSLPLTRSTALQARVLGVFGRQGIPELAVSIRRGDIAESVLAEAREKDDDGLVIGYHRGGPPGVLEAGSVARRLAHAAPCAVLTIPL